MNVLLPLLKHSFLTKSLFLLSAFFLLAQSTTIAQDARAARNLKWREDLQYFKERVPAYDKTFTPVVYSNHIDSNRLSYAIRKNSIEAFLKGVDSLYKAVDTLSDEQIMIGMCQLMALSPNAHTRFYLFRVRTVLNNIPFGIYWFGGALRIVTTPPAYSRLLGSQIKTINGLPVDLVKKEIDDLISGNSQWEQYMSLYFLRSPQVMKGLYAGASGDQLHIAVELLQGGEESVLLKGQFVPQTATLEVWRELSPVSINKDSLTHLLSNKKLPLYLQQTGKDYSYQYLKKEGLVYLQFNRATDMKEVSFEGMVKEMIEKIKGQPFTKFVFDLRFNTGGNYEMATKAIEYMTPYLKAKKTYIITGPSTFSAGIIPVALFKRYTNAKIIGEPAGDDLLFLSEGGNLVLPHSKLNAHYANGLLNWRFEKGFSIQPDKEIRVSFEDYLKGEDTILNFILHE
jgi:hypothetical protein